MAESMLTIVNKSKYSRNVLRWAITLSSTLDLQTSTQTGISTVSTKLSLAPLGQVADR